MWFHLIGNSLDGYISTSKSTYLSAIFIALAKFLTIGAQVHWENGSPLGTGPRRPFGPDACSFKRLMSRISHYLKLAFLGSTALRLSVGKRKTNRSTCKHAVNYSTRFWIPAIFHHIGYEIYTNYYYFVLRRWIDPWTLKFWNPKIIHRLT